MEGTRVLVTGGGRGIGAHTAEHLAERGCRVAICARTEEEIEATAARISAGGVGPVKPYVCDVSDPKGVREMITRVIEGMDGLDVLVNNAGVMGPMGRLEDAALEDWRRPLEVNLFGTVNCTHAVLPWMMEQGHGKIINVAGGGIGWKKISSRLSAYVTSKFALYGFTEAMAKDLEECNIQVNIVSPGPVETALWDGNVSPERRREIKQTGQDLSGEPVARLIAFLASARSAGLTGKILSANWDDLDDLEGDVESLNGSCRNTLRKIDGINYFSC